MIAERKLGGDQSGVDSSNELTVSAKFDLLSNARRRCVLRYLLDDPEVSVRTLSRHVAARENDVEPENVTASQRKRVYTGLHQTHLPRLNEHGVIEYDSDRGTVRASEHIGVFEPYLTTEPKHTGNDTNDGNANLIWPVYYVGVGLGGLMLTAGVIAEVPLFIGISAEVIALIVGAAILTIATVHVISTASLTERDDELEEPDSMMETQFSD